MTFLRYGAFTLVALFVLAGILVFKPPTLDFTLKDVVSESVDDSSSPSLDMSSSTEPVVKNGLSMKDLELLAGNKFSNDSVPLGDYKYTTSAPKKGYVFLCRERKDNPGAMTLGPWVHGSSWSLTEKIAVSGHVSWPNAVFSNVVSGVERILSGNGLPINHQTGVFPVQSNDPASKYDKNPNTISPQTLKEVLPAHPTYLEVPHCMGGEVGIMLSGVPLFNAFDAGLRDAPAHEVQDSCDGHPQGSGEYHYHSLSSCFQDTSVTTVIGYAYDGFPITGPFVTKNTYLVSENLDVCHGLTSEVVIDGKKVMTYHYVMTKDFPYSVSCFRGTPVTIGPSVPPSGGGSAPSAGQGALETAPLGASAPTPPQEAIDACKGLVDGANCTLQTPDGMMLTGSCHTPPNTSLACIPN